MREADLDASLIQHTSSGQIPDIRRLASLCGGGEIPFPLNLTTKQSQVLAQLVRQHRRERLLDFLASRIADAILAEDDPLPADTPM